MGPEDLNPEGGPDLQLVESEPEFPMIDVVVQIDDVTVMRAQFEADPEKVGVIRFQPEKLREFLDQHKRPKISVYRDLPAGLDREV